MDAPRLACELLAARLLRLRRLDLYLRFDRALSERELAAMRRGVRRVGRGEPLQYVLGEWDFRGHVLRVDRRALIPRPETEQLVQRVLDCVSIWSAGPAPSIVDVGTGSGCIVISLALERPAGRYVAVDVSADALSLARDNAQRHHLSDRIRFVQGELGGLPEPGAFDVVVANPPYIGAADLPGLPAGVRDYEPVLALDGGSDGMQVTRRVVRDAAIRLRPGGRLFLEIGETQSAGVTRLLQDAGFEETHIEKDHAGHPRFAMGRLIA